MSTGGSILVSVQVMTTQLDPNAQQLAKNEAHNISIQPDKEGWEYYVDEKGNTLYRRRWMENGQSEFERPNGSGGYMPFYRFSDICPVLFNLPAIVKAKKRLEPVVFCHKETEVRFFKDLGITATCSSADWRDQFEILKMWGGIVILITDQEMSGWVGVMKNLEGANFTCLPLLDEGQTITDWLTGIKSRDQFMEILAEDGEREYPEEDDEDDSATLEEDSSGIIFEPMILKDWKDTIKETDRQWIVDNILPEKSLSLISALPKAGKSTWTYSLAEAVSNGKPFMGHQVKQTPVLILALEEMDIDIKIRTTKEMPFNENNTFMWNHPLNADGETLKKLGEIIEKHKIGLVIVDCLTRFWDIDDENSASQVNQAIKPILQIARSKRVAIFVIHHSTKAKAEFGKDIRGSGDLFAHVDIAFSLDRYVPDLNDTRRVLQTYSRYKEIPKVIVIKLENGQYIELGDREMANNADNENLFLSAILNGPLSSKEIAEKTGLKEGTVRTIGQSLYKNKKINSTGKGAKGDPHKYSKVQNDSAVAGPYSSETISTHGFEIVDKSLAAEQIQPYSPPSPIDPPSQGALS